MDVMYADSARRDIGVLIGCEMDLAYGKDENNFSVTLDLSEHCCEDGYFVYIENTEYGGIVDKICPDSDSSVIEYKGRTWHGILENKVLEPDVGQDYLIVNGEANTILRSLIERMDLSGLFRVSEKDSGIVIKNYQFARYVKGYTGIRKMLQSFLGKLRLAYSNKYVELEVIPLYDYSQDEEWDTSQLSFQVEKDFRPVNHLVCLGKGDLKNRKVIHLFSDENGGIRPYANVQDPYMDAHYILDKSKQVLFREEERTEVLDYGNAETREVYILLSKQPSGWATSCVNYFVKDGESYKQVEIGSEERYIALESQPNDWYEKYSNYFYLDGDEYKTLEGLEMERYEMQKSQPSDWNTNYSDYYQYYSDGLTSEYKKVSAESAERYILQTMRPSDWSTTYKSYYRRKPVFIYFYLYRTKNDNGTWSEDLIKKNEKVSNIKNDKEELTLQFRRVKEYVYQNPTESVAPIWVAKKYYTKDTYNVPPEWKSSYYYTRHVSGIMPEFESGMYYRKDTISVIPAWKSGTYYQKYEDNFAALVESGIEKMKEYADSDSLSAALDSDYVYDVGDIVGSREIVTGLKVSQPVTKKIVNISRNIETITYEIGE